MVHVKISELEPGMSVESVYLIQSLEKRQRRSGEAYVALVLQDKSGTIQTVMWENARKLLRGEIVAEDFVKVSGDVGLYNNQLQLTLRSVEKVADDKVDLEQFLPHSKRSVDEMQAELRQAIESVKAPHLKALLKSFFDDAEFLDAFSRAPSAMSMHQAYIGGLLEHTLAVLRVAHAIGELYPPYDRDLLTTGVLLHDMGKIREFAYKRAIRYTSLGRLLGHITISFCLVDKKIDTIPDFPQETRIMLLHLLLSHHGLKEWGSPRRPKTLEALLLHYADYIDAYLSTYRETTERARERGELWTDYQRMFERFLFAGLPDALDETQQRRLWAELLRECPGNDEMPDKNTR
jgi:3'-5' exoribonuclease